MLWYCEYCGSENYGDGCCTHCSAPNPLDAYITKMPQPDVFMDSVESSFIDSIGYDELGKRLIVRFDSEAIYEYQNVSKDVYSAFIEAESKGHFYSKHIRGKFESRQL